MCLITKYLPCKKKITKKQLLKRITKVAKKNIVCYKRFNMGLDLNSNKFISPHRNVRWPKSGVNSITRFTWEVGAMDHSMRYPRIRLYINRGLHAFRTEKKAERSGIGSITKKMIIPKGTKYILGRPENGHIVALKMRFAK